jgi:Dyp-type peroxidase family
MPQSINLAEIQGDVLRGYGNAFNRASYVFVHVDDAARGRAWLRGLAGRVTTAAPWQGAKPETTLNVAVTCAGLGALGVPAAAVESFSHEFRDGMAARAVRLGDTGAADPANWDAGLGRGLAHVLVTIKAQALDRMDAALEELRAALVRLGGLTIVHEEHAHMLDGVREHFGFADGFAQPAIEGVNDDKAPGGGVPEPHGRWRSLALGEFILGYEDEQSRDDPERRLPSSPIEPFGRSGTYMVWRKLHQDVSLFRKTLVDAARLYEQGDEAKLAAKIVGRWRNGTPLVASAEREDPDFSADQPASNDFRYDVDGNGYRCPIGSHIRRSNPRDALGFEGRLSFRHRLIRRGMPYGPPLPEGAPDDGEDRGLVFVCFNASISRQFEGVQLQWLNDGNIFYLGHDQDFVLGGSSGTGKMTVQGEPPFLLAPQLPFVTTRGGEYLFVPGIAALAALAGGGGR